jgi:hypothetical protein
MKNLKIKQLLQSESFYFDGNIKCFNLHIITEEAEIIESFVNYNEMVKSYNKLKKTIK